MKKINLVVLLTALMAVSTFAGVGSVQIYTTNAETEEPIPGISYAIYTDSGCQELVQQAYGNSCGVVIFNKLYPGQYFIRNEETSGGFKKDDTVTEVIVSDGMCTTFSFSFTPSSDVEDSGPQFGKFTGSIKGTISGAAINNIKAKPKVRFVCSDGEGKMTPEYGLVNNGSYSYCIGKDVSIKCVPFSNSLQYKFGTTEAKSFLSIETISQAEPDEPNPDDPGETTSDDSGETTTDDGPVWEPVVFITDKTSCSFAGKMTFIDEPKYLYNCAIRFAFGDEKSDFVSDEIPLVQKGNNYSGTLKIDMERGRTALVKVKINLATGRSKFSFKGTDLIGVESRFEPNESK